MSNEFPKPDPNVFDIYWERWIDAYNNEEINASRKIYNDAIEDVEMEMEDGMVEEVPFFSQPVKTIMTPFGVLPLTEQSLASNHFKFWVGHSNFKLYEDFRDIIEDCDGVESLDIMTPYRFRIAIGKMFIDRDVMNDIRNTLVNTVEEMND